MLDQLVYSHSSGSVKLDSGTACRDLGQFLIFILSTAVFTALVRTPPGWARFIGWLTGFWPLAAD